MLLTELRGSQISACAELMTRRNKLQNSFGYGWPDQGRDHLGRAIDGLRNERLTGLPASEPALQYMPGKMRAVLSQ